MKHLPLTTNKDLQKAWGDPLKTTRLQMEILAKKQLLLSWHRKIYKYMAQNLSADTVNVEIGSGSSRLYEYVNGLIRSNLIFIPENDLSFRAEALPFSNNSVGNIILINVLHHLADPLAFFKEAQRVLKSGGRILISDPYLSAFSYLFWRYLHPEGCNRWQLGFNSAGRPNPLIDANSANATILFTSDKEALSRACPELLIKKVKLHSKFHYWLAGGYNFPQLLPTSLNPLINFMEQVFSPLDKWLASFMFVVIEKEKEDYV